MTSAWKSGKDSIQSGARSSIANAAVAYASTVDEVPPGQRHADQRARPRAGVRIADVAAPLGRPRGGHCDRVAAEHPGQLAGPERIGDPDLPRSPGFGAAGALHVAAAVDAVVGRPGGREHLAGALDGPALDVAGRVERAGRPRGEVAVGLVGQSSAAVDDLAYLGRAVTQFQLAAGQATYLAVGSVGGEGAVDPMQPAHRRPR